ncbi:VOC family protein [Mesorhizobium sp. BAC0120]|uniref:VOC family protein n=1 Tax=Mesorhizobium sp. BAC0120 TaxID=3090670 RepID=UPI00298C8FEC|nr:VOC family protein [Mesorhizobium sp. BAC0120]MDW6021166.1 VOC family protein [Mesorhizobium sp. BAC0120]
MASNFVWYELMTSDVKAAEAFYKDAVGWTPETWPGAAMPYVIMKVGDRGVAGLMTIPEEARAMGQPPAWLGYIYARDADATTEAIRKAGGTVHREPADIPEVGRFAVVADPQGAIFMLLSPKGPDQASLPARTPGTIGWHELYTTDWQAAIDFYSGQFGWTKDEGHDMGDMGIYQLFSVDGQQIGGMMNKPPQVPVPAWLYYFTVPDIDAAAERVKKGGGNVLMGPMEVPGGSRVIQAQDPQGAIFALMQPAG